MLGPRGISECEFAPQELQRHKAQVAMAVKAESKSETGPNVAVKTEPAEPLAASPLCKLDPYITIEDDDDP